MQLLSSSSLFSTGELSDTKVYEPQMRVLLGAASHFCEVNIPKLILEHPKHRKIVGVTKVQRARSC